MPSVQKRDLTELNSYELHWLMLYSFVDIYVCGHMCMHTGNAHKQAEREREREREGMLMNHYNLFTTIKLLDITKC